MQIQEKDHARRFILSTFNNVIFYSGNPDDCTLQGEHRLKCDNCEFDDWSENFQLDTDGEICDSCYQRLNEVDENPEMQ